MKTNSFIVFIAFIVLEFSCDYNDDRLQVKNNSNENIIFDFSDDTLLELKNNEDIKFFIREKIVPGETSRQIMQGSVNGWPFLVQRSKNNRLNVFFINMDTLSKYNDWIVILKKKLYNRKEFTLEELEKNEWVIEYP